MTYHYITHGTCSRAVDVEIEGGVVRNVRFVGGCNGNTQGIARLVTGRPVDEVISLLSGIPCNGRPTSCPDQLARALRQAQEDSDGI